jgi:trimeric autotransporter adhesin
VASREGSGSGGASSAGGDARALHSVLHGPVFRTQMASRAERASGALARRWAPEDGEGEGGPSLRALRFADRHLSAYLGGGRPMRGRPTRGRPTRGRPTHERPARGHRSERAAPSVDWLLPELWFGDELDWMSAARAAVEERARAWPEEARFERAGAAARASEPFGLPLELVAPGLAERGRTGATRASWRAYTPLLDGVAARAAGFLAELLWGTRAGERERADRRAPLLQFVTAADLAEADPAAAASGGGRLAIGAGETASGAAPVSRLAEIAFEGVSELASGRAGSEGRAVASEERALELLAGSVAAGRGLALAAGPRVLLPAGLGGFVSGSAAARAVEEPGASTGGAVGASSSLARVRPAGLDHVLWADRWLARFAGASPRSLRSFDAASAAVSPGGSWRPPRWTPAWVAPRQAARPALAPSAPVIPSIIVDDDEPVADSVFGAIAAAAAADREAARSQGRARPAARAGAVESMAARRRERSSPADRALAGSQTPAASAGRVSPGLSVSLAASPLAPLFAALIEFAPQRAFDARALSAGGLAAVLAGKAASRRRGAEAPGALRLLAERAPGAVWLAAQRGAVEDDRSPEQRTLVVGRTRAGGGATPPAEQAAASAAESRPGTIATRAEAFAGARAAAASDLALDFLDPALLAAARAAGVGPIEAARAQRLAASGRPHLMARAAAVDRVFVEALSRAHAVASRESEGPPAVAAAALEQGAPVRAPRGAVLLPEAAGRALGVTGSAASLEPDVTAALELVAAGRVAEAAASPRAVAAGDTVPLPTDDARAQLPRQLWPIFEAVYASLGASAETRPLAPSARAARALALASRSVAPGESVPPDARAAAAWAALPVVLRGGDRSGRSLPSQARASDHRPAARAGEALGALIAPTMLLGDADEERDATFAARSRPLGWSPVDAPLVATGAPPSAAAPAMSPAPAPAPSPPAQRPPELDSAWFEDAARKYFADAGPASGGISLAEMTLVTAAPRAQIAASPRAADRVVTQAASTASAGGDGAKPDAAAAPKPDIDKIAQEVFEQICRMVAVARERSGDPWQR